MLSNFETALSDRSLPQKATAIISLNKLRHNISVVRQIATKSRQLIIIKANLYGHQIDPVLNTINQSLSTNDVLGVTDIESAIKLKKTLPCRRILLLHGISNQEEARACFHHHIEMVTHHPAHLNILSQHIPSPPAKNTPAFWLKVDTGMGRLGFTKAQIDKHQAEITAIQPHAIMTHLASADCPSSAKNTEQIKRFASLKLLFPMINYHSIANSGALLNQITLFDKTSYVRPGIMIYGLSPNAKDQHNDWDKSLKPILSLYAPIIALKLIEKGDSVGYGCQWQSPQDGLLAVIKIGYADGYPRLLGNQAHVFYQGKKVPVVGRISMDLITVFLGNPCLWKRPPKMGEWVELWGENICLYDLAEKAQTIPYELLVGLAQRVHRISYDK